MALLFLLSLCLVESSTAGATAAAAVVAYPTFPRRPPQFDKFCFLQNSIRLNVPLASKFSPLDSALFLFPLPQPGSKNVGADKAEENDKAKRKFRIRFGSRKDSQLGEKLLEVDEAGRRLRLKRDKIDDVLSKFEAG